MTELPTSIYDIDADWVSRELEAAGHGSAEIAKLDVRPLEGFVGALGEVAIVDATYAEASDLPTSFIGKCPLDDDMARMFNMVMQAYKRECGFYRDLADVVPMTVPAAYVNLYDAETDRAVMLLERIDGEPGDIFAGCSVEQMEALLVALARLHGQFWMDPAINGLDWKMDWLSETWQLGIPLVEHHWHSLTASRPDMVSAALDEVLHRTWIDDIGSGLAKVNERPWTLAHNDYELDNIIFTEASGGGDAFTVLDWQTAMKSHPGVDIGWLLSSADTEEIVAEEASLLDAYRAELHRAGGPQWSHDEVMDELVWGSLFRVTGMSIAVDQAAETTPIGDRHRDRLEKFLAGALRGCERWDLVGRLS